MRKGEVKKLHTRVNVVKIGRKNVSMIMLTTLLLGISTSIFNIQPVKAGGTIYIRANGSVDPPTAPISSVDNVTYTFTDDIYDEIVVERDDIVVDGAGYTVQGTGSGTGIYLSNRSNVTIKNTEIKIFDWGINLYSSSNNSIFGNNITENNEDGIGLRYESRYNDIFGNNITENNGNGICLDESSNNTVSGNNSNNNNYHGIFLYSSENNLISNNLVENSGYDGIFLNFSDNNLISNNTCEYNGWHDIRHGIELHNSEHNLISNNTCSSNYDRGISLSHSDHNTISYNICENNYYHGIHLDYSSNNTISNNTCEHNGIGLNLDCSSSNTISNNTCENNANNGIGLFDSSNNSISRNNITANNESGVWLDGSNYNSISGNNITANTWSGIGLPSSSNNTISGNNVTNSGSGIWLRESSNNTLFGNTVTNNTDGIYLETSSNNTIYHNNFIDNTVQASDSRPADNDWHHPTLMEGNYWSDYQGVDDGSGAGKHAIAGDGIGDTLIPHPSADFDYYPFMSEFSWRKKQVETATGTGTATFETDAGAMEGLTAVDEATLPPEGKPDIVFPHGFFSFKVTGLMPGQTVTITITLPFAMPPMSEYWKYHDPEGYLQIPMGSNDGDEVITITLTDGGTLDGDGAANGEIVDDGGPAQSGIPVGGIVMPVNRLEIAASLIGQYALVLVTAAITVIVDKRILGP